MLNLRRAACRRRVGCGGGRLGGVQPAEGAAAGDEPAPHPRQDARPGTHPRRAGGSRRHALLHQDQDHQRRRRPRLLRAPAAGNRRRRQRERAMELVNSRLQLQPIHGEEGIGE